MDCQLHKYWMKWDLAFPISRTNELSCVVNFLKRKKKKLILNLLNCSYWIKENLLNSCYNRENLTLLIKNLSSFTTGARDWWLLLKAKFMLYNNEANNL